ncbi:hypothetical protein [Bradyrhizobium monzae]|uniref:hypothetical protein n=1 Tax=Bradyrhizobium sp. Oc8 TaxID=2876780 RepID=UPI001F2887EE|nr:hypothetical protein [Bradyrhizobium sp. Oc8]
MPQAAPRSVALSAAVLNAILVVLALIWLGSVASYTFRPTLRDLASHLMRGERYDDSALERIVTRVGSDAKGLCDPKLSRNVVLIQLRLLSNAIEAGDAAAMDLRLPNVTGAAKQLIACSPSESIGWLALYWAEIRTLGFSPSAISYLTQSYTFAPHEMWVQLFRAPLALRAYGFLPEKLKQQTLDDFDDIVGARQLPTALVIYQAASAATQAVLLNQMCSQPDEVRLVFRRFAQDRGFTISHPCFPASASQRG